MIIRSRLMLTASFLILHTPQGSLLCGTLLDNRDTDKTDDDEGGHGDDNEDEDEDEEDDEDDEHDEDDVVDDQEGSDVQEKTSSTIGSHKTHS